MSKASGAVTAPGNENRKRGLRPVTTVSSHMVNYPLCLQAARPERTRQSLLSASPAYRALSAQSGFGR